MRPRNDRAAGRPPPCADHDASAHAVRGARCVLEAAGPAAVLARRTRAPARRIKKWPVNVRRLSAAWPARLFRPASAVTLPTLPRAPSATAWWRAPPRDWSAVRLSLGCLANALGSSVHREARLPIGRVLRARRRRPAPRTLAQEVEALQRQSQKRSPPSRIAQWPQQVADDRQAAETTAADWSARPQTSRAHRREAQAEPRTRAEAVETSQQHVGGASTTPWRRCSRVDRDGIELQALSRAAHGANRLQPDLTLLEATWGSLRRQRAGQRTNSVPPRPVPECRCPSTDRGPGAAGGDVESIVALVDEPEADYGTPVVIAPVDEPEPEPVEARADPRGETGGGGENDADVEGARLIGSTGSKARRRGDRPIFSRTSTSATGRRCSTRSTPRRG